MCDVAHHSEVGVSPLYSVRGRRVSDRPAPLPRLGATILGSCTRRAQVATLPCGIVAVWPGRSVAWWPVRRAVAPAGSAPCARVAAPVAAAVTGSVAGLVVAPGVLAFRPRGRSSALCTRLCSGGPWLIHTSLPAFEGHVARLSRPPVSWPRHPNCGVFFPLCMARPSAGAAETGQCRCIAASSHCGVAAWWPLVRPGGPSFARRARLLHLRAICPECPPRDSPCALPLTGRCLRLCVRTRGPRWRVAIALRLLTCCPPLWLFS